MKILITGICGFAGSVIARGLLEHQPNLRITGIDNLCRRGSETNVEPLRALGLEIRIGDIRNEADIAALPPADWVIDCAANPSVLAGVDGKTSAKELLDHNLGGTIHLLEYCRRHTAGFLLLSTSRVYSIKPLAELPVEVHDEAFVPVFDQEKIADSSLSIGHSPAIPQSSSPNPQSPINSRPQGDRQPKVARRVERSEINHQLAISAHGVRESFPTDPPISLYGSSKKCSELLALEYGMTFDFPVRINRCGVLAGAGQFGKADQGIFSYWIHSWASRRPLKYIGFGGKGHQVRDCLHPRDLVPLIVKQIQQSSISSRPQEDRQPQVARRGERSEINQPSIAPIINLSGGVENSMSLAQLSRWCAARLGPHPSFPLSTFHLPPSDFSSRPFDIPWMVLDSRLAGETWNWQPATPITAVLEEIVRHAEANPGWLDLVA